MWEELDRIMRETSARFAEQVVIFLPGLLAALGLLLVTVIVAVVVRLVLIRVLHSLDFDRRMERVGVAAQLTWPGTSPSLGVARLAQWVVVLFGVLISLTALNAAIPSRFALSVLEYLPHIIAAASVALVGGLAARLLAQSVLIGAVNMRLRSARLISLTVKWVVLVITATMVLDHLGIGPRVLSLAFGILFGGVVLAAALAIGLGSRDAVARAIEERRREADTRGDQLHHV